MNELEVMRNDRSIDYESRGRKFESFRVHFIYFNNCNSLENEKDKSKCLSFLLCVPRVCQLPKKCAILAEKHFSEFACGFFLHIGQNVAVSV